MEESGGVRGRIDGRGGGATIEGNSRKANEDTVTPFPVLLRQFKLIPTKRMVLGSVTDGLS